MIANYSWLDKPVVMNIVNGNSKGSLCCTVVNEFDALLRIRISDKWDVHIYKDMIRSIEPDVGSAHAQLISFFEGY